MRLRFTRAMRWAAAGLLVLALAASMIPQALAATGPIGTAAGFEDNDGNLAPDPSGINFDWNSFSPVTWTGTAPYQNASKLQAGWHFVGLTDAQASSSDTGFAGGTKQDQSCAPVIGSKAPNKDDLKRVYLAHRTVLIGGTEHVFLVLAWERIPQNSTTASAHVGFEFNQGTTPCPAGSDGLVQRTAGDLLFVYDFTGGSAGVATLTVRKWVTTTGAACDISSDSAPCWGVAQDLTASGFAEAGVDSGAAGFTFPVTDTVAIGSGSPTLTSADSLGQSEFGEAGVDLTAANIFPPGVCSGFGQVEAVSRSSGNSGTAAMEDLVGPGHITITNCGNLVVKKVTDPSPDPTNQSFSFTLNGSNNPTTLPKTFSLVNGGSNNTQVFPATDFSVVETVPTNWALTTASCDNGSGTLSGSTLSGISVIADETVTCTFFDKLQLGAIKITKTSSKAAATPLAGATFSITGPNSYSNSVTTGSDGTACVDHLLFGTYSVTETAAPAGYSIDNPNAVSVSVSQNADCAGTTGTPVAAPFHDTPLTDLTITATSEATGGTQSTITCVVQGTTTGIGNSPQGPSGTVTVAANGLKPGIYTCTVNIDP